MYEYTYVHMYIYIYLFIFIHVIKSYIYIYRLTGQPWDSRLELWKMLGIPRHQGEPVLKEEDRRPPSLPPNVLSTAYGGILQLQTLNKYRIYRDCKMMAEDLSENTVCFGTARFCINQISIRGPRK